MLEPGDKVPDLTLPDQKGNPGVAVGAARQAFVLYFYPKAETECN
jgi:peroxiredoxin